MRLKNIRLAGFKSFADLTSIHLDHDVCAIVGPNGCGKSNIVDALRWAIGERSAQVLRGSTFHDVIFDGTDERVPSSHASVELLFDNTDSRMGGEYASYTEISVRRELEVEQQSVLYLNGRRCRSRDIQDLFLGTGFGTKGYAIIEQGLTDQLVRSKPEELRHYLEEAAGVTNYRERRHETELKILRTEQNILRVQDGLEVLAAEIRRLNRQVSATRRYQRLQQEINQAKIRRLGLLGREKIALRESQTAQVASYETELSQQTGLEQKLSSDLLELRQQRNEALEEQNARQANYYQSQSKITRNESEIELQAERVKTLSKSIDQLNGQISQYRQELEADEKRLESNLAQQRELLQESEEIQATLNKHQKEHDDKQHAASDTQQKLTSQRQQIQQTSELRFEQQQALNEIDRELENTATRIDDLGLEVVDSSEATKELNKLAQARELARKRQEELESAHQEINAQTTQTQTKLATLDAQIDEQQSSLQETINLLSKLNAEQDAALGLAQETDALRTWLSEQQVDENRRLISNLRVDKEWEVAIEVVLGNFARAIQVDQLEQLFEKHADLSQSGGLFAVANSDSRPFHEQALIHKVQQGAELVDDQLRGILVADSFVDAMGRLGSLEDGQSFITQDGIWLSSNWVKFPNIGTINQAVLSRVSDIVDIETSRKVSLKTLTDMRASREDLHAQMSALRTRTESLQSELLSAATNLAQASAAENSQRRLLEETDRRNERIVQEIEELQTARQQLDIKRTEVFAQWQTRERELSSLHTALANLEETEAQVLRDLGVARVNLQTTTNGWHENQRNLERINAEVRSNQEICKRQVARTEELEKTLDSQQQELQQLEAALPELQSSLSRDLQEHRNVQEGVEEQAGIVQGLDRRIQQTEIDRRDAELTHAELQSSYTEEKVRLEKTRAELSYLGTEAQVAGSTLNESIEAATDLNSLETIESELARLERSFSQLGAVNHRAIEDHAEKVEQKKNKDQQLGDLERALSTLKSAIAHIDQEIRGKVQHTFDAINENLSQVFPRLFGGGRALLELTGESLLDAGVVIRVKPPGKADLSINLLSGGEKALAALSFVFAVFLLNPSPVCILDEVDAPLDQQNVERFATLLHEMVDTQFVVITHNPLTMERMKNLLGVTMEEPGVSRVVSVSLDTAVSFAQNG